jgi:hypothetical protein
VLIAGRSTHALKIGNVGYMLQERAGFNWSALPRPLAGRAIACEVSATSVLALVSPSFALSRSVGETLADDIIGELASVFAFFTQLPPCRSQQGREFVVARVPYLC